MNTIGADQHVVTLDLTIIAGVTIERFVADTSTAGGRDLTEKVESTSLVAFAFEASNGFQKIRLFDVG